MKKLLIGSTALFAVGAISSAAQADIAKLSVSGQVDIAYSILDTDGANNTDGTDGDGMGSGNSSTQLIFDWGGATESGLEYGARLDYRFQNDDADELYVFLAGDWGRLHIGGDDGVIDNVVPGAESVLAGAWGFDGNHNVQAAAGANLNIAPTIDTYADDAMKFSYYSPSFSGFSAGLSYIPNVNNSSNTTGSGVTNTGNGAARGDAPQFEGTLAYSGTFDAVGLSLGIGYAMQDGGDGFDDAEGLKLGGTVTFAGFSLGAGFGDNGDTGCAVGAVCDAGEYWNVGLAYSFGPGSVSIGYLESEDSSSTAGAGFTDEGSVVSFDADYRLADGLQAFGGVNYYEADDGSANTTAEVTQGIVGLRVSF